MFQRLSQGQASHILYILSNTEYLLGVSLQEQSVQCSAAGDLEIKIDANKYYNTNYKSIIYYTLYYIVYTLYYTITHYLS